MELDLNKALLLSFLSILALSFPCQAVTWSPPGHNLSTPVPPPCGTGAGTGATGCRIADLQPELEAIADPGMLGASLVDSGTGSSGDPNSPGCGRQSANGRYTPCTPDKNPRPDCGTYCRTGCHC